jgi:hypothetical protein
MKQSASPSWVGVDPANGPDNTAYGLVLLRGESLHLVRCERGLTTWSQRTGIRIVQRRGERWYCARDVHSQLGISWKGWSGSLRGLPDAWVDTWELETPGGRQEGIILNTRAVLRIADRSRSPTAAATVRQWVALW